MNKNKLNFKKSTLAGIISLLCVTYVHAQENIYGTVNDQGVPLTAEVGTSIANPHSENVIAQSVTFYNEKTGLQLSGVIYKPRTLTPDEKKPAVIVTGPMMSVKEQTQSLYAQRIAAMGYVTMVFDYSYFGTSAGEPRDLEDPDMKAEDIKSAVSYLKSLSYVEQNKIAGVGICGSGSYMPFAATTDERIKAVVSIVPFTVMNSAAQAMKLDVQQIHKDKTAWEHGVAGPTYLSMISAGSEGAEYYLNPKRNTATTWHNYALSWSIDKWTGFDPVKEASKLSQPYLVITAEKAFTLEMAKALYQSAGGQKSFYELKNARHFDMYDLDPYVSEALDQIKPFLKKNLG